MHKGNVTTLRRNDVITEFLRHKTIVSVRREANLLVNTQIDQVEPGDDVASQPGGLVTEYYIQIQN